MISAMSAIGPSRECSGFGCLVANGGEADGRLDRSNFAFDPKATSLAQGF